MGQIVVFLWCTCKGFFQQSWPGNSGSSPGRCCLPKQVGRDTPSVSQRCKVVRPARKLVGQGTDHLGSWKEVHMAFQGIWAL